MLFESKADEVSAFRHRLSIMEQELRESIEQSTRQLDRLNQRWPLIEQEAAAAAAKATQAAAEAECKREITKPVGRVSSLQSVATIEEALDSLLIVRMDAATQVERQRPTRNRPGGKCGGGRQSAHSRKNAPRSQVTAQTQSSLAKCRHVLSPHWVPI
jgi:hypothetical protein